MKSGVGYPELIVALASAAWGLYWIPLRAFEREGLGPAWATPAQFLAPLAVLLPFVVVRWRQGHPTGVRQYRTGFLTGSAVALFLESLLLTDVARALILFYALPAWGTILEVGVMRRSFTRWRSISLLLSVAGMLTIIGGGGSLARSLNAGDIMALLSGILFAIGAMRMRQTPETSAFEQVVGFFLYGAFAALALSQLPVAGFGRAPSLGQWMALAPWLLLTAAGFLIPVMWGILWGSRHVDPGRLGILLQIEAVVGIVSAALFAGEPFGLREAGGAALVIGAGLVEVLANRDAGPVDP